VLEDADDVCGPVGKPVAGHAAPVVQQELFYSIAAVLLLFCYP
jgi:hypothetical protein